MAKMTPSIPHSPEIPGMEDPERRSENGAHNAESRGKERGVVRPPVSISFFVSGDPKAQPRPRAFARKFGDKWQARVYDASTAEGWKSLIALTAKPHLTGPISGPIRLECALFFKRPKAHFLRQALRTDAPTHHTVKPDSDNLEKAIMDALTQIGAWVDDSQVCQKLFSKTYSATPGAQIDIIPL